MLQTERAVIRTQIQLTEEQARALKELAARQGVSMAELIRRAVERTMDLESERERRRLARAVLGRYHGQAADVAVNHDRYLDEIYGDGIR